MLSVPRPHPACPDGESDGQLAHLRKGSRPPRACHVGEADLLAKRLSAALANRLIHHPRKVDGVSFCLTPHRLANRLIHHPGKPDGVFTTCVEQRAPTLPSALSQLGIRVPWSVTWYDGRPRPSLVC